MEAEKVLEEFGLTPNEVKAYLACLSLGTALVQDIAKKAGIYRTYTYELLRSLKEKGVVSYIIKSGKQYFEVANPEKLLDILKEREEKLKVVLPELRKVYKSAVKRPNIEVYEGKEGLKTIFNDMVKEKKEILNMASGKDLFSILKFEYPFYIKKRIQNKISTRVITEKGELNYQYKKTGTNDFRKMRFLPNDKSFTNATFVYGDKVAIMSIKKELIGVLIADEEIAKNHRLAFEILWGACEKD